MKKQKFENLDLFFWLLSVIEVDIWNQNLFIDLYKK